MRLARTLRSLALAGALAGVAAAAVTAPAKATGHQPAAASHAQPAVAAAPTSFVHPGVNLSTAQLDFVRAKVQANAAAVEGRVRPDDGQRLRLAVAHAQAARGVECGPVSNPNNGCTDERQDAIAAYTDALAWYINRDDRYAQKAIQIMDAWSAVLQDHTNDNAPLQTAWAGASWPKAAEIIKHVYTDWAEPGRGSTPCCATSTCRRSSTATTAPATGT